MKPLAAWVQGLRPLSINWVRPRSIVSANVKYLFSISYLFLMMFEKIKLGLLLLFKILC